MDSGYYIRYNILDIIEDKISDLKAVKTIRYKTGRKMTKQMNGVPASCRKTSN